MKAIADGGSPSLEQHALAALIDEGHYARHLKRVTRRHVERRSALVAALQTELRGSFEVLGAAAGLHVALRLPNVASTDEAAVVDKAAQRGVAVSGAERYFLSPPSQATLLLGHARVPAERMSPAIRTLAEVLRLQSLDRQR